MKQKGKAGDGCMKKKIAICLAVLVCAAAAAAVAMTGRGSGAEALGEAVRFPMDSSVEAELWRGGEKLPLQVTDAYTLQAALEKATYVKKGSVDVITAEQEAYVLTLMTENRMEKFTILPQEGTGYWAGETPAMFRCEDLVEVLPLCVHDPQSPYPPVSMAGDLALLTRNPQAYHFGGSNSTGQYFYTPDEAAADDFENAAYCLMAQYLSEYYRRRDDLGFMFLEHQNLELTILPSRQAYQLQTQGQGSYGLHDRPEEVGEDIWVVTIDRLEVRYVGILSPFGPSVPEALDENGWLRASVPYQRTPEVFHLLRRGNSYVMFSKESPYAESYYGA